MRNTGEESQQKWHVLYSAHPSKLIFKFFGGGGGLHKHGANKIAFMCNSNKNENGLNLRGGVPVTPHEFVQGKDSRGGVPVTTNDLF